MKTTDVRNKQLDNKNAHRDFFKPFIMEMAQTPLERKWFNVVSLKFKQASESQSGILAGGGGGEGMGELLKHRWPRLTSQSFYLVDLGSPAPNWQWGIGPR